MNTTQCGSWLACDSIISVCQLHLGDAIAGKPAPTQARSHIWFGACLQIVVSSSRRDPSGG
ncbi:hypothetical protein DJ480_26480 [Pseudomonas sp. Leaf98]|nr:hypothetical protein DJ480_26480 [Pseudomonas sp. Leaf98]